MPRKVYLAPHLSTEKLKKKYRTSEDPVESRRWHLLWKISLGWTIKNSAIAIGLKYEYCQKILKRYNEQGEEGVKNGRKRRKNHRRGKEALLNEEQLEKLKERLKKKPDDLGKWTGPKVARWIEKEIGIEKVWNQRGWEYLKKCGYSWQRPRPKHRKGEKEAQEKFKKDLPELVEKLKKHYPNAEIEVWFFDEHRVGLKPILCKVWAPIGERPIAEVQHRYEWLYVYGFVNPKTGKTHWYLIPRVNVKWLNAVFKVFAQEVGASENKKILLVEDRAGWHRSEKVELPEGIITEFLPPYSPELQPAERLWSLVDEPLVNTHFETLDELGVTELSRSEEVLAQRCCYLQDNMMTEIKNLTDYHWFTYA